jgi:hypothetical protein
MVSWRRVSGRRKSFAGIAVAGPEVVDKGSLRLRASFRGSAQMTAWVSGGGGARYRWVIDGVCLTSEEPEDIC